MCLLAIAPLRTEPTDTLLSSGYFFCCQDRDHAKKRIPPVRYESSSYTVIVPGARPDLTVLLSSRTGWRGQVKESWKNNCA